MAFLLCEKIEPDDAGRLSLLRLFDKEFYRSFPTELIGAVYAKYTGVEGRYTRTLLFIDPDGREVGRLEVPDVTTKRGGYTHWVIEEIRVPVATAGLYELRLLLDGEPMSSYYFEAAPFSFSTSS